jgi:hypothetical protein
MCEVSRDGPTSVVRLLTVMIALAFVYQDLNSFNYITEPLNVKHKPKSCQYSDNQSSEELSKRRLR